VRLSPGRYSLVRLAVVGRSAPSPICHGHPEPLQFPPSMSCAIQVTIVEGALKQREPIDWLIINRVIVSRDHIPIAETVSRPSHYGCAISSVFLAGSGPAR
jgi:hypothetical protein